MLVYKAIQATIGMDSIVPYAVAAIVCFLASVLLLFIYLSRRVGDWIALAAVLPILFMGTAYEDLLTAFQINYFGSVAFGIGALLAIERRDRRGDLIACVLLLASLAFAEIALAFAAGVLVAIVIQRGPLRRCWVIAVPAVLYALWYAIYEAGESSSLSLQNVALSPAYVVDGFASSLGSLFGQGTPILFHGEGGLPWGRPLLVAAIVGATFWLLRPRTTVRASILIPLAVGLVFWLLTAANYQPGRPPTASRYQYVGAVFVLLIAGELAAGWRPRWRAILAAFAVSIAAAAANLVTLHDGYRASAASSATVRGGLGGLEIAADRVSPDLVLTRQNSNFDYFTLVRAGPYLSASEKFGSPAYSQSELASASEPAKEAADKVLAAALPVSLRPGPARPAPGDAAPQLVGPPNTGSSAHGSCVTVHGRRGVSPDSRAAPRRRDPESQRQHAAPAVAPSLRSRGLPRVSRRAARYRRASSFQPTARAAPGSFRSAAPARSPLVGFERTIRVHYAARPDSTSRATARSVAGTLGGRYGEGQGVRAVTPTETKTEVAPAAPPADGEDRSPRRSPREGRWDGARSYARDNVMLVAFVVLGVIARIVFWAATDRKLDDAMITIKFDKNLADGFGLVHNFGEGHVQGFTSALSVLVPMPGELIYHGGGFLFIRLASVACFALAAVYAYRIARRARARQLADRLHPRLPRARPEPGVVRCRRHGDPDRGRGPLRRVLLRPGRGLSEERCGARIGAPGETGLRALGGARLRLSDHPELPEGASCRGALRRDSRSLADLHLDLLRLSGPEHDHREEHRLRSGLSLGHPPRRLDQLRR